MQVRRQFLLIMIVGIIVWVGFGLSQPQTAMSASFTSTPSPIPPTDTPIPPTNTPRRGNNNNNPTSTPPVALGTPDPAATPETIPPLGAGPRVETTLFFGAGLFTAMLLLIMGWVIVWRKSKNQAM